MLLGVCFYFYQHFRALFLGSNKKPKTVFLNLGYQNCYFQKIWLFTYRVGKMTLEKVRFIKNSKQVKFRGFLRLAVTFKINSHKSYWAQIHRKHLSSPVCSQNRA